MDTHAASGNSWDGLTAANDLAVRRVLETACIEFIDENGMDRGFKTPPLVNDQINWSLTIGICTPNIW